MPGLLHKAVEKGTRVVRDTLMKDALKDGILILRMLIKAKVLAPILLILALAAGVYYDKITGDVAAAFGVVVVIALLVVRRLRQTKR